MTMVFGSVEKSAPDDPFEVFWLVGFSCNAQNDWKVRVVYRNKRTGRLKLLDRPIGMLPILSLGIWFDHGVLRTDALPGERVETLVPNVGEPDIITSAQLPPEIYPFPRKKLGIQKLFRYRTAKGDVLIPVIELVRFLFVHNRALALALMRPSGLEQLYESMEPGERELAELHFKAEISERVVGHELAKSFGWIVLDREARRAWDSVFMQSKGEEYVLFDPPAIHESVWVFRGIRYGNAWLVLELEHLGGRQLPFEMLKYSHPGFQKTIVVDKDSQSRAEAKRLERGDGERFLPEDGYEVDDGEGGTLSYRSARVVELERRRSAFKNTVRVVKVRKEVEKKGKTGTAETGGDKRVEKKRVRNAVQVSTGERANTASLPPLEFKAIAVVPMYNMGDLEALDETVRHMRDKCLGVGFRMTLVQLKQKKVSASIDARPKVAMVVRIDAPGKGPIILLDVERTGIVALSLMTLSFTPSGSDVEIEAAIQKTLDGWVDGGGHWSSGVEAELKPICQCERIPKAMIPRDGFRKSAGVWGERLIERFKLRDAAKLH